MTGLKLTSFLFALSQAICMNAAPASEPGPSVNDLLELKAAQAESMEVFEAEVESTVSGEDGVSRTTRARIKLDKVAGTTRMQKLDDQGQVMVDIKTEGTQVSFLTASGSWQTVELDEQTKLTLEEMGVDFGPPQSGSSKQRGLGGWGKLPKDKASRRSAKRQRIKDGVTREKGRHRFELRTDWDRDSPRAAFTGVDLSKPLAFESEGLLPNRPQGPGATAAGR